MTLLLLIGSLIVAEPTEMQAPGDPFSRPGSVLLLEYNCELSSLERADSIILEAFAPIMNDLLETEQLTGWAWLTRDVGDEWSRAFYVTAADRTTLLSARDEVASRLRRDADSLRREFLSICRESRFRVYRIADGHEAN